MLARGLRSLDVGVACVTVQLRLLSRNKDKSIKNDRRANFQSMLRVASGAAARGDSRALYKIAHQAAGKAPEPHKGLKDKFGCLLTDATDIEGRWVEHFSELLSAQPMTECGECCETFEPGLTVEFEDILRIVNMLNPRKASGTDWISAELLLAGGGHTARHIMSIGRTMVSSRKWASQLAGAWIAKIFKKEGDEQEVDAWRGVLVGS